MVWLWYGVLNIWVCCCGESVIESCRLENVIGTVVVLLWYKLGDVLLGAKLRRNVWLFAGISWYLRDILPRVPRNTAKLRCIQHQSRISRIPQPYHNRSTYTAQPSRHSLLLSGTPARYRTTTGPQHYNTQFAILSNIRTISVPYAYHTYHIYSSASFFGFRCHRYSCYLSSFRSYLCF